MKNRVRELFLIFTFVTLNLLNYANQKEVFDVTNFKGHVKLTTTKKVYQTSRLRTNKSNAFSCSNKLNKSANKWQ